MQGQTEVTGVGLETLHLHPPFVVGAVEGTVGADDGGVGACPRAFESSSNARLVGVLARVAEPQCTREPVRLNHDDPRVTLPAQVERRVVDDAVVLGDPWVWFASID